MAGAAESSTAEIALPSGACAPVALAAASRIASSSVVVFVQRHPDDLLVVAQHDVTSGCYIPHTVIVRPPTDSGRRKIFSSHDFPERSKTTR